jgi:hypothetical protein
MSFQAQALETARGMANIMAGFESLSNQVTVFLANYERLNYVALWEQMATIGLRPDGSPGQVDPSPNPANPINLPPENPILISVNDLNNGLRMLENYAKWWVQTGQLALPEQPNNQTAARMTH